MSQFDLTRADVPEFQVMLCTNALSHYATYVRAMMPLRKLLAKGHVWLACHEWRPTDQEWKNSFLAADVLWCVSVDSPHWYEYLLMAKEMGKRVVVDCDDDKWDCDPRNTAYGALGREEANLEVDGETLPFHRDGIDGFSLRRNSLLLNYVTETARLADTVTVTTKRLAAHLEERNARVAVLPNCVDLDRWRPYRMNRPGFRIGWQGGASHKGDMLAAAPQIGEFVRRHPDVTMVVSGYLPKELSDHVPVKQAEFNPWVHLDAYPESMQVQGLDLGLAPLENTRFNAMKSALKWTEYGAMGVPCAASNVPPYSDYILHGIDGWLVEDDGWLEFLEWAYAHRNEVASMGKSARAVVEREYDADKQAEQWLKVLREAKESPGVGYWEPPKHVVKLGGGLVCR